jgi:enoyl-[acyl-carrier protein] reductase II
VRGLKNKGLEAFVAKQKEVIAAFEAETVSMNEAQLAIEHFWAGALRKAVQDGDIEAGSLMAGQSVGLVQEVQTTRDILANLLQEMLEGLEG